jgi:hypothetical protein
MDAQGKRTLKIGITVGLSLGAIVGLVGCADQATEDESGGTLAALESENGLSMNGLSMNGLSMNGLSMNGLSMNGLSMNGLSMNGLSTTSGLMTTSGGRDIVKYMVKCAYPQGHTLNTHDQNGVPYSYDGYIGIAPEAENGPCGLDCQEKISACLLAHVNNSGQHIGIWLVGPDPGVGWGGSTDYPYQEGAFFGNLIVSPWDGSYCAGSMMSAGEVPGRLGSPLTSSVYVDPYGMSGSGGVPCAGYCQTQSEGYINCPDPAATYPYTTGHKWSHVVTVWRNFESSQMYKICNKSNLKCLGVVSASTADGANIEQRSYSGAAGQTWQILQVSPGQYKIINVNSGKALDASATQVVQRAYAGSGGQLFPIAYRSDEPGKANIFPSNNAWNGFAPANSSSNDGTLIQLANQLNADVEKWTFTAVGAAPSGGGGSGGGGGGGGGSDPCASFCSNPTTFSTTSYQSPNLGTNAVCISTTAALSGGGRYNTAGRTFSINGQQMSGDGSFTLPAKVNGGYCFQATAGGYSYATFNTW